MSLIGCEGVSLGSHFTAVRTGFKHSFSSAHLSSFLQLKVWFIVLVIIATDSAELLPLQLWVELISLSFQIRSITCLWYLRYIVGGATAWRSLEEVCAYLSNDNDLLIGGRGGEEEGLFMG